MQQQIWGEVAPLIPYSSATEFNKKLLKFAYTVRRYSKNKSRALFDPSYSVTAVKAIIAIQQSSMHKQLK